MPAGTALIFDVETIPSPVLWPRRMANKPEFVPPGNYKDVEIIKQFIDRKEMEWQEDISKTMSLSPILGNVVCLGYQEFDMLSGNPKTPEPQIVMPQVLLGDDRIVRPNEKAICDEFWQKAITSGLFIGFNTKGFDVPFMEMRSRFNDIIPPVKIECKPYDNDGIHVDLMALLGRNSMSLDSIRKWYNIYTETPALGKNVFGLWQAGKYDEIAAHCRDDIRATVKLAQMLSFL